MAIIGRRRRLVDRTLDRWRHPASDTGSKGSSDRARIETNSIPSRVKTATLPRGDAASERLCFTDSLECARAKTHRVVQEGAGTHAVHAGRWGLFNASTHARLFIDGASADDPVQGMIGDCTLIAVVSAIAGTSPDLLQRTIRESSDGSFTVQFYEEGRDGGFRPVDVTVDRPSLHDVLAFFAGTAHSRDSHELWVSIVEKAYAQWKGGYDKIDGIDPVYGMQALTGKPAESFSTLAEPGVDDRRWALEVFEKLRLALASGRPMITVPKSYINPVHNLLTMLTGVPSQHAYAITGTSKKDGVHYVHLRNPWGMGGFAHLPGFIGDGNFEMPVQSFIDRFDYCVIANAAPEDSAGDASAAARLFASTPGHRDVVAGENGNVGGPKDGAIRRAVNGDGIVDPTLSSCVLKRTKDAPLTLPRELENELRPHAELRKALVRTYEEIRKIMIAEAYPDIHEEMRIDRIHTGPDKTQVAGYHVSGGGGYVVTGAGPNGFNYALGYNLSGERVTFTEFHQ